MLSEAIQNVEYIRLILSLLSQSCGVKEKIQLKRRSQRSGQSHFVKDSKEDVEEKSNEECIPGEAGKVLNDSIFDIDEKFHKEGDLPGEEKWEKDSKIEDYIMFETRQVRDAAKYFIFMECAVWTIMLMIDCCLKSIKEVQETKYVLMSYVM